MKLTLSSFTKQEPWTLLYLVDSKEVSCYQLQCLSGATCLILASRTVEVCSRSMEWATVCPDLALQRFLLITVHYVSIRYSRYHVTVFLWLTICALSTGGFRLAALTE